jgi:hypothetical protein
MSAIDNTDMRKTSSADKAGQSRRRRPYAPPTLKVFGPVGTLTQSGSRGGPEANPRGPMTMA